jgi:hypothetical protein
MSKISTHLNSSKCHLQESTASAKDCSTGDHLVDALPSRRDDASDDQDDSTSQEKVSSTEQIGQSAAYRHEYSATSSLSAHD